MIGNNLKVLRSKKGMSQKELADFLIVSPQAVSRWEKEEVEPDIATLKKLGELFGVSVDDLINKDIEKEGTVKKSDGEVEIVPVIVPTKSDDSSKTVVIHEREAHVCEYCQKDIEEGDLQIDYVTTRHGRSHSTRTAYYHKECLAKKKEEAAKAAKVAKEHHGSSAKAKCWGWSIPAGIVTLLIVLFSLLTNPDKISTFGAIGAAIISGYGIFSMVYCIISGSYIGDVFLWAAGLSVKFPGIIFSFDLDGFAFLIVMKILFAILGFLIGIAAFLLAVVLSSLLSIVSFPFILIHNIHTEYDDAF